jgi:two-component system sensor kinase FixL
LSVSPVRDAAGRVVGGSVIARDVTEERRNEARVRSILDTAVDGIIVIDTHGHIQIVNPAVERQFGYTAQEMLGQNVSMLMPSPTREQHDESIARYLSTGNKHIIGIGREVEGRRKDGTRLPLALSVSETRLGHERTFTGILHDLTQLKRSDAQLRDQAELARLGQMAAVIAHEVRNPLAGIRGALDVIGRRLPADSRDKPVLVDVVGRLESLNQFVNDLLLFSRPERAVTGRHALRPLFQRLAALLKNDPEFAGIVLDVEGPDVVVSVDSHLMERALLNLLVNAAQSMKGRGAIRVRTRSADGMCQVSVTDSGPGIPSEMVDKIFEPFFTTKHRGTGLGLPIVKRTIEQHGGHVSVHSTPGIGTTVVVQLPLPPA